MSCELTSDEICCRAKLHKLFSLIEKEFECLYLENAALQEKLDTLTEKVDRESLGLDTRLLHPDYQETEGGPASAR